MSKLFVSRLALFAFLSASLAACGGGGGSPTGGPMPATIPGDPSATGATTSPLGATATATPAAMSTMSMTASNGTITASGSVAGIFKGGFTMQTASPHGFVHIYTNSSTRFTGAKLAVGQQVTAVGTGSFASVTATSVTQVGATGEVATPTPVPSKTSAPAVAPPNGNSTTPLLQMAKAKIAPFQVFDAWGSPRVSAAAAEADGPRYSLVWGARPGMASAWRKNNSSLIASYYMPQETDASWVSWGGIGHNLAWWEANHPDWVLYSCTASGTPTKIPAYVGSLPQNIPLDIHNPAVVQYQVKLAASYALKNGYNGLAYDEVLFQNIGGVTAGAGAYACGIYQNGTFVRRYSSKNDVAWADDTVAWVKAAHAIAAANNLKLVVNHPAGSYTNANEAALLANVDVDLNETGYADYSNYTKSTSLFKTTTDWTRYAQAHGAAPITIDKFYQSAAVTPVQVEYGIATYLMSNEGGSGLFISNNPGYGVEQFHSEYNVDYGTPCAAYYGGSATNAGSPDLWYRRYSNAFVVVNSGSTSRSSEVANLPAGHTYRDLEGRQVSNALTVANHDAYVLLTTNGCN